MADSKKDRPTPDTASTEAPRGHGEDIENDPDYLQPQPNRDPISGSTGAHPAGVAAVALTGATAGAVIGALGGPAGAAVGSAIGGTVGALATRAISEAINPSEEDEFWREHYTSRPYIEQGASYEAYRPAFRFGWEAHRRHGGRSWEDIEPELSREWTGEAGRGLTWEQAKHAVRDAWERVEGTGVPGDAGRTREPSKTQTKNLIEKDPLTGEPDANRDPITGEPGAHPVGVGAGAIGGGAVGAAVGSIGGPVGAAVGGAVGAVAGGLAAKGLAEQVNPTVEDEFWREHYTSRPYIDQGASYEAYRPAYRYGWESYGRHRPRSWEEVEPELSREWTGQADRRLTWDQAKHAVRDAWERVERRTRPGEQE